MRLAPGALAALLVAAAGVAAAQEAAPSPAEKPKTTATEDAAAPPGGASAVETSTARVPVTTRLAGPSRPIVVSRGLTAGEMDALLGESRLWAKWACLLAGLAMVGVIWVGWSMRTLAKNQVELGWLIQRLMAEKG